MSPRRQHRASWPIGSHQHSPMTSAIWDGSSHSESFGNASETLPLRSLTHPHGAERPWASLPQMLGSGWDGKNNHHITVISSCIATVGQAPDALSCTSPLLLQPLGQGNMCSSQTPSSWGWVSPSPSQTCLFPTWVQYSAWSSLPFYRKVLLS